MQNDMGKDEISESSFRRNSLENRFVLWIGLKAKANSKDKAANGWDESGQEWVERECSYNTAVNKLDNAGHQDES